MHPALARTNHRPWPLPRSAWKWRQSWCDLLFAHWPVPAACLRPLIPDRLTLQTSDGTAWLGIVPFRMSGVMRRPLPDLPWISAFPEINVRTYVECDGRPGVFFLSLDATNPLAVWAARRFFHLPYFHADIALQHDGESIRYRSRRKDGSELFESIYGPTSAAYEAMPGTLEHWLTERYCLYALTPDGTLTSTQVHHAPWPLQHAKADIPINTMTPTLESITREPPSLLHFVRRIDVVAWPPEEIAP